MDPSIMAPSPILDAVRAVLADGKPRSADEIVAEGKKRGLFGPHQTGHNVYGSLFDYINRALWSGNKPFIIKDVDGRFRLNQPIDDWPAIDTTGLPPLATPDKLPPAATAGISALRKAATGSDPDAFERAVCGAFENFGFAATHIGGKGEPDGYADALLGILRYRVMLECKLGSGETITESDAPVEAGKFKEAYHGDYCLLVAPAYSREIAFASELQTHGISAWTVDDLVRAATLRLDCSRMRELFAPGYASPLLDAVQWEQVHGAPKRLRCVASWLLEIGLAQQRMAQTVADGTSALRLTADVAASLIDDRLSAAHSTRGVTRDEIDAAFTWLTSPYVDRAIWTDDSRTAIVIRPCA